MQTSLSQDIYKYTRIMAGFLLLHLCADYIQFSPAILLQFHSHIIVITFHQYLIYFENISLCPPLDRIFFSYPPLLQ